eukprot:Hpha_TRINITY_DN16962_c2_g3::TRINITY_DN16962_c2_g3_i2::g.54181::m.54181
MCLRSLLPSPGADSVRRNRADVHELPRADRQLAVGKLAFGYWAVEVLNEVRAHQPQVPCLGPQPAISRHPFRVESLEQHAYLGWLRDHFGGCLETVVDGYTVVWTDGSAFTKGDHQHAGGGAFFGAGNLSNRAYP